MYAKCLLMLKESRTDVQFHLAALRGDCDRLRQLLDTGKVHIDSRDRALSKKPLKTNTEQKHFDEFDAKVVRNKTAPSSNGPLKR
ncbi:hypothetical protein HF086_017555 [Spodoptera exigua]|uniref:Uncharacterized protein n=1 Tax=Spodoptera exigua TaxID=7107 RepID=A0A922N2F8_SPOEX|nr:hypothetical protein HF086_017555 [Spodoptera exigua]